MNKFKSLVQSDVSQHAAACILRGLLVGLPFQSLDNAKLNLLLQLLRKEDNLLLHRVK